MTTARAALIDALQVMTENRLGGYSTELYGPKADAVMEWLKTAGFSITKDEDQPA